MTGRQPFRPHPMIDTCHAWRAGGEVVQFVSRRKHELARGEAHVDDTSRPPGISG